MKTTKQQGFTLIELIVVIVILGILSATALPKFFDLGKEARVSVLQGAEAAMRGADTMIYAKSAAKGQASLDAGATVSVLVNGATVLTKFGYAKDATVLASVLTLSPASDFTVAAGNIQHAKATTPGVTCAVLYTPAADAITPPVYTFGDPEKAGC